MVKGFMCASRSSGVENLCQARMRIMFIFTYVRPRESVKTWKFHKKYKTLLQNANSRVIIYHA